MTTDNNKYCERNRLETFSVNWPHSFISPRILAKTGFYSIGPYDQVKCVFCEVEVHKWEELDDEVAEHIRWSPNCPLMKRRKTNNIPIESSAELNQLLPPISYDVCGSRIDRRPGAYETPTHSLMEHTTKKTFVCGDILAKLCVYNFVKDNRKMAFVNIESTLDDSIVTLRCSEFFNLMRKIYCKEYDGYLSSTETDIDADADPDDPSTNLALTLKKFSGTDHWQVANGGYRCCFGSSAITMFKEIEREMLTVLRQTFDI